MKNWDERQLRNKLHTEMGKLYLEDPGRPTERGNIWNIPMDKGDVLQETSLAPYMIHLKNKGNQIMIPDIKIIILTVKQTNGETKATYVKGFIPLLPVGMDEHSIYRRTKGI